jgi:hypothetical protein
MPHRLTDIFDLEKTPSEDRFNRIAACEYLVPVLIDAENYKIFETSTPIENSECLARVLESPNGVDLKTGTYSASAFMEATKRGISTQRTGMTTSATIHEFGKFKMDSHNIAYPAKPRTYLGYTVGETSLFRNATAPDGRRLFGVFSTPEPEVAHADIFVVVKPDKGLKLAIQRVFYDAFKIEAMVTPTA